MSHIMQPHPPTAWKGHLAEPVELTTRFPRSKEARNKSVVARSPEAGDLAAPPVGHAKAVHAVLRTSCLRDRPCSLIALTPRSDDCGSAWAFKGRTRNGSIDSYLPPPNGTELVSISSSECA